MVIGRFLVWALALSLAAGGFPGVPNDVDLVAMFPGVPDRMFFTKGCTLYEFDQFAREVVHEGLLNATVDKLPIKYSCDWSGAFRWTNHGTYVLSPDGTYFRFRFPPESYSSSSSIPGGWRGMPAHIDDVIDYEWDMSYWISGTQLFMYDNRADGIIDGGQRVAADVFPGIPFPIDGANLDPFSWDVLFFKGSQYWLFDRHNNAVKPGYPKPIAGGNPATCTGNEDVSTPIGSISDRVTLSAGYQEDLECSWTVSATVPYFQQTGYQPHRIYNGFRLQFKKFGLSNNDATAGDYIEIWANNDGPAAASGAVPVLFRTFLAADSSQPGTFEPFFIGPASRTFTVKFFTDSKPSALAAAVQGFVLSYAMETPTVPIPFQYTQYIPAPGLNVHVHALYASSMFEDSYAAPKVLLLDPKTQTPTDFTLKLYFHTLPRNSVDFFLTVYRTSDNSLSYGPATYIGNCTSAHKFKECELTVPASMQALVVLEAEDTVNVMARGYYIVSSTCNGRQNFTDLQGVITDGSGGFEYYMNSNCEWLVSSDDPDLLFITLDFTDFATEYGNDPVKLYEDYNPNEAKLLTTLYGQLDASALSFQSSGSVLLVKFTSNQNGQYGGFSGNYKMIFPPDATLTQLSASFDAFWPVVGGVRTVPAGKQGGNVAINSIDKHGRALSISFFGTRIFYYLRFIPDVPEVDAAMFTLLAESPEPLMTNGTAAFDAVQDLKTKGYETVEFSHGLDVSDYNVARSNVIRFTSPEKAGKYRMVVAHVAVRDSVRTFMHFVGGAAMPLTVVPSVGHGPTSFVQSYNPSPRVGEATTLTLVVRDAFGNPLESTGTDVRAFLSGAGAISPVVKDQQDGTYLISVQAQVASGYRVNLFVNGQDVGGTPLSLDFLPEPVVSAPQTLLVFSLPASTPLVLNQPYLFDVIIRDRFGNPQLNAPSNVVAVTADAEDADSTLALVSSANGTYTYSLVVKGHSNVAISVRVNGALIPGSPFALIAGTPRTVPSAPRNVSASASDGAATVYFDPPLSDGGAEITGYTVRVTDGSVSAGGTSSPIVVRGLPNYKAAAFVVTASNFKGAGPASAPSNVVTPVPVRYNQSDGFFGAMIAFAVIFIVATLAVAGIMIWFRRHKVVKAASLPFCLLTLFGALMIYVAVIMIMTYPPTDISCALSSWFGHLGFGVMYGALLAKTWRVGRIFNSASLQMPRLTNMDLLTRTFIVISVIIVYLVLWTVVDPPLATNFWNSADYKEYVICQSGHTEWQWAILIPEAIMLAIGVGLCWYTHNLPSEFNEAKWIAFSILQIGFVGLIVVVFNFTDQLSPESQTLLIVIGLLVGATVAIGLVFTPKILIVFGIISQHFIIETTTNGGKRKVHMISNYEQNTRLEDSGPGHSPDDRVLGGPSGPGHIGIEMAGPTPASDFGGKLEKGFCNKCGLACGHLLPTQPAAPTLAPASGAGNASSQVSHFDLTGSNARSHGNGRIAVAYPAVSPGMERAPGQRHSGDAPSRRAPTIAFEPKPVDDPSSLPGAANPL